jgi:protein-L-isoaspartate O-methyltransferase
MTEERELDGRQGELEALDGSVSEQLDSLRAAHAVEVAQLRAQLEASNRRLEEVAQEFRSSTSWRVTAPLRAVATLGKRLAGRNGAGPAAETVSAPAPPPPGPPEDARASYPASYFETLYNDDPDPWGFATRWYERRKYAITVASLPRERYRRVFEPACSIGVLSESLAQRCDRLLASDSAPSAVDQARRRLGPLPHVEVEVMEVPGQWPEGRFDLIVLSEFAYFLDDADLASLVERTVASLDDDGHVVAVHYLPAGRIVQTADEVHAALRAHPDLANTVTHREPEFVLDVFVRAG